MSLFSTVSKPTLLLNEGLARNNLEKIFRKANLNGVLFRPHFKTHQSAEIGNWFTDLGIDKITVSSVDMALYFANHGWEDILIAFPVNIREIEMLSQLAKRINLSLLVESGDVIRFIDKSIKFPVNIRVKVDTGSGRSGVAWKNTANIEILIKEIQSSEYLNFGGILTHAGQTYRAGGAEEVKLIYNQSVQRMVHVKEALSALGFKNTMISVGDTPGVSLVDEFDVVDEIRPGNFLFYDVQQARLGACSLADIAVSVACPIVALHPERNEIVLYGGAIHLSKDWYENPDGASSYGLVVKPGERSWDADHQVGYLRSLSQEHGVVKCQPHTIDTLAVGDILCVLPAHSCLTVQALRQYTSLDNKTIHTLNSQA